MPNSKIFHFYDGSQHYGKKKSKPVSHVGVQLYSLSIGLCCFPPGSENTFGLILLDGYKTNIEFILHMDHPVLVFKKKG